MKKYGFFMLLTSLVILLFASLSCSGNASLGKEFSLYIGQTAAITGEDLEITFTEVSGDSRCPSAVVCIQAGEVKCLMKIKEGGTAGDVEFIQSGGTSDYSRLTYGNYRYTFKVDPYPVSGDRIPDSKYRILITVDKK